MSISHLPGSVTGDEGLLAGAPHGPPRCSSRPTEVLTQSRGVLGTRRRAPSGLPRPSQELCSNPDSVPVTEQALCCKLGVRRDPNIHPTHKGITPHGKQECRAPFHVKNMAFCVGNSAQHKGKRKGIVGKEDTSS